MNTRQYKSRFKSFAFALLVLLTLYPPASAGSQSDARRLSDSLSTAYESTENGAGFDASTADLDNYMAYAAGQSPALKAAFYQWKSVLERSGYTGALPDPWFSYSYFIENVETRVGPQNQVFRLRQSFPWFGTLGAKKDITLEAANAALQKFESAKLSLFYQVKSAYYEFYYLGRDIAITRENLELLTFWESVARAKYRVALKQHPDVIKAQVELGKLEDRLRTVEDMISPVAARLRAAINLPDSVQLVVPSEIEIEEVIVNHDRILEQVMTSNPDLKSLLHLIDKENAARRLANKLAMPSFFVGVDYIDVGEAVNPDMFESGKDAWNASVGVSLPIWFGANKARKQEAEAQYRKAQNNYADALNRLNAFAEKVIFEYEDALRKSRLYRDGLIPKAEQSLNASYTAYQAGESDFLNVLDAQRQLLDFQLQYERSRSDLAIKRAEIEMIAGNGLPGIRDE